jgi:release factor glutamine methyltransferase
MTVQTALLQGVSLLLDAGIAAERLTAELLLSHAMGRERIYLYAHPERELKELEWLHYGRYLHERMAGKPTQYITRKQEFYGREFRVTPDVLIPRPETEHVVELALAICGADTYVCRAGGALWAHPGALPPPTHILDVGAGSGTLAVTLRLETGAETWATDISSAAAAVAAGNARSLNAPVHVLVCDLMESIAPASMDLIVSNPPYVPLAQREGLQREVRDWEPHVALFAGETGFEIYDRIVSAAPRVLRPGGWLIMELGFGSCDYVSRLLEGWRDLRIEPDLAGIPRVIAAHT